MKLDGKTALITGGAGVIGRSTAKRLREEGARVMLVDRDEDALRTAASELKTEMLVADVTDPSSVASYAQVAHERLGPIDIFFNNAGIEGPIAPIHEYPDDAFAKIMAINVTGVFLGLKYTLPRMADGGSVIITSSIVGLRGGSHVVGYSASKAAVIGIMRAAALEAAPRRIRVNTIHPAPVESILMERVESARARGGDIEAVRQRFIERIPLGRYVEPEEVAGLVLFLSSDESRMITGTTVGIDGGSLAG